MPNYLYQHPTSLKVKEIFQSMLEEHVYVEDGIKWNRVFTVPGANFDNRIDQWNPKDFVKATNKKGKFKDLQELSKELSEKRGGTTGQDPIREKYYEDYSKKYEGKRIHKDVKARKAKDKLKKLGFDLK